MWPSSPRVQEGVHYRFDLYTRCGVGNAIVDFDASLWFIPPPGLDRPTVLGLSQPAQPGVITLIDDTTSRFISDEGPVIEFLRHRGSTIVPRCALGGIAHSEDP